MLKNAGYTSEIVGKWHWASIVLTKVVRTRRLAPGEKVGSAGRRWRKLVHLSDNAAEKHDVIAQHGEVAQQMITRLQQIIDNGRTNPE